MESDDCSAPSADADEASGGQHSRAECNDETSYVSQNTLQSRKPSSLVSQDGQSSESEYRSIIPNKRIGGEYRSRCESKSEISDQPPNKRKDGSVQPSGRVIGSRPPSSECGSGFSERTHSRLRCESSNKVGSCPLDGDLGSNQQERNDGKSDIGDRGVPHTTPSEPFCNISHGREGEDSNCLEDPLIKRKVRVGDLASLLSRAQPKAG